MNNLQKAAVFKLIATVIISLLAGLMTFLADKFLQSAAVKLAISISTLIFMIAGYILADQLIDKYFDKDNNTEAQNYNRKLIIALEVICVVCALSIIVGFICGLVS